MGQNSLVVTTEGGEDCRPSTFDTLFSRNVPHILEKIFFSLDHKSFKTSMEVCQTWKDLLTSASYQKMLDKLLIQKENNEKKLLEASRKGNTKEVRRLISSFTIDVNCEEEQWYLATPLHFVSKNGKTDLVNLFLDRGADPNKADDRGMTSLHEAIEGGHTDGVQVLLNRWADPNNPNKHGDTPLHLAVRYIHKDVVIMLLKRGAHHYMINNNGETPLSHVTSHFRMDIVNLLNECTKDP